MNKKILLEIARDLFHGYLGFAFSYFAFAMTNAILFTQDSKAYGVMLGSAFCGLAINVAFNFMQGLLYGIDSKRDEYYIGIIGGLMGGWVSLFYPSKVIAIVMLSIAIIVVLIDLIRTKKQ